MTIWLVSYHNALAVLSLILAGGLALKEWLIPSWTAKLFINLAAIALTLVMLAIIVLVAWLPLIAIQESLA